MRRLLEHLGGWKLISVAVGVAAVTGWVGFALASQAGTGPEETATESPEPVVDVPGPVVVPVPFEGDPEEAAEELREQLTLADEASAANGVPAGAGGSVSMSPEGSPSNPSEEPTATTGADTASTASTSSGEGAGDESPEIVETPAEVAADECADGGEECPIGVAGTILALEAEPALAGTTVFQPATPGTARGISTPECPARDPKTGEAYFGISTSRPARIIFEYRSKEFFAGEYVVPETTVVHETTADREAAWIDWLASPDRVENDPDGWIDHCFVIEAEPRDDYVAFVRYEDLHDPSITAPNWAPVHFHVPTVGGVRPGSIRRPTLFLPLHDDQLYVATTRQEGQTVRVAAHEGNDPGVCDVAGDESAIGTSGLNATSIHDLEIDADTISDPAYPYLREYTHDVLQRLDLGEGTDYVVCVYWLGEGTSFDSTVVDMAEHALVSTPEAYRPRIVLHGLTDLIDEAAEVTLDFHGCGRVTYDLEEPGAVVTNRLGASITSPYPEELCLIDSGLGEIGRRGLRVDATVISKGDSPTSATSTSYVRMNLDCNGGECRLRLPEMAAIMLPRIPSETTGCSSDPFTGCLSDGTHPAGRSLIEIQFDRAPGNGAAGWSTGEIELFDDSAPPLPDTPRIDAAVSMSLAGPTPMDGAEVSVVLTGDRPMDISLGAIEQIPGDLGACDAFALPSLPAAVEMAEEFTASLGPLCIGATYRITVEAIDSAGEPAEVTTFIPGQDPTAPPNTFEFSVPMIPVRTEMSLVVTAPDNANHHTVYAHPVYLRSGDRWGPVSNKLGWTWPASDRAVALAAGWDLFGLSGRANACGRPESDPLEVHARRTSSGVPVSSTAYLGQEGGELSLTVEIFENRPLGGAVGSHCVPGDAIEIVELRAPVTLEQLRDGITLSSESGAVDLTLRAWSFGDLD